MSQLAKAQNILNKNPAGLKNDFWRKNLASKRDHTKAKRPVMVWVKFLYILSSLFTASCGQSCAVDLKLLETHVLFFGWCEYYFPRKTRGMFQSSSDREWLI